jgi:atypical dual specificity phosphatase
MTRPNGFFWLEQPYVAGLARPGGVEDLHWLRREGIEVVISLTEEPLPRTWVNEAGLFLVHTPVPDMEAPTAEQILQCITTLERAIARNMGVAVHCGEGKGRTGTMLACYLVTRGLTADQAINRVRRARPGAVETEDQTAAIVAYARGRGKQ